MYVDHRPSPLKYLKFIIFSVMPDLVTSQILYINLSFYNYLFIKVQFIYEIVKNFYNWAQIAGSTSLDPAHST